MDDEKPLARRQFFRRGLGELLKPLARALEPIGQTLEHLDEHLGQTRTAESSTAASAPEPKFWLRPPGALSEKAFRETCSRCAACVDACPAEAIKLDRTGALGEGVPYIVAAESACVACDGLRCMPSCPSGALGVTPLMHIKMGTAVWRDATCVRTRGQECTTCVEVCPVGHAAIEVQFGEITVKPLGCIGCGLCEQSCPTTPKSIVVIPKAARER
ncbi:MAG TPA: 4Fe-4S dicluster domain-containing protein [Tepidisphaeraceae bacterium]|jgi:ferredoxin-type protein NapG